MVVIYGLVFFVYLWISSKNPLRIRNQEAFGPNGSKIAFSCLGKPHNSHSYGSSCPAWPRVIVSIYLELSLNGCLGVNWFERLLMGTNCRPGQLACFMFSIKNPGAVKAYLG